MKHLVLGSRGQIGSHLVRYLEKQGEQVFEFDILNEEYQDLRLNSNPLLDAYMQNCDIVHFLAFDVGGAKYLEQYQDSHNFIMNNMKIMVNTFDLLRRYNKPFIFASSQMAELSYSTYGVLKLMGEKLTQTLGGLVVKFWNVYGYEHDEEKSHVITDFIKMAKYDKEIYMRTDGTESRQFLYADDACECLLILAKKYPLIPRNENLHITSFKWNTINEVANIIDVLTSCTIHKALRKDETQRNAMNEPDPFILNYWRPTTSLENGIMKLLSAY
jgi:nucleoside-diphosphate-sugar epimerase